MPKKSKVLQIGVEDWCNFLSPYHQSRLEWNFINLRDFNSADYQYIAETMKEKCFNAVICTDGVDNKVLTKFSKWIETYSLIVDESFQNDISDEIKILKYPKFMNFNDKNDILTDLCHYFFPGQAGRKHHFDSIIVSDYFHGTTTLSGQHRMKVEGVFPPVGSGPLLTWKNYRFMDVYSQEIWLEFKHSENVKIAMNIVGYIPGQEENFRTWNYTEAEIKQGIEVKYEEGLIKVLNISLSVYGEGTLEIGPLHYRDSRNKYGEYLLGGEKIFDDQNEEIFYYFNPGDLAPPLNVYFGGYHSLEMLEGFNMMKSLGAPFLLISDPRLEGGKFYLGSRELEKKLLEVILNRLNILGFSRHQLILSGLSMGTFGALYYASQLSPHTVIIGKPLANLGNVAANERIIRPGGFPTSLDVLRSLTGTLTDRGIENLNRRFWDTFDKADFGCTQFIVSYMENDDYDERAYEDLLEHLSAKDTLVVGKGIPGRHNDNSHGIFEWFIRQYNRILIESFGRKE